MSYYFKNCCFLFLISIFPYFSKSQQCSYVKCVDYIPDSNICLQIYKEPTLDLYQMSICPNGTYCSYHAEKMTENQVLCQPLKENGQKCNDYLECESNNCVNSVCSPRLGRIWEIVNASYECAKSYYRNPFSGKCEKQIDAGFKCGNMDSYFYSPCKNRMICDQGYCWPAMYMKNSEKAKNKYICASLFINSTLGTCGPAPVLMGSNGNGLKSCRPETMDKDCTYSANGFIYTATQLKKSCICTRFRQKSEYFCELGEGDESFIKMVKMVF